MLIKAQQLPPSEIESLLQECIDDLYLVIDLSANTAQDLYDVLLDFQTRVSRRLMGNPIQLHWDFQKANWPSFSKTHTLQILRILQEGLHNALKHSKAKNILISAVFDPSCQQLNLKIADDGTGLPSDIQFHRGLKNMTDRALQLGGEMVVTHVGIGGGTGTTLELQLRQTPHHLSAKVSA
jgi:signal transduction histidine kinase